MAKAAKLAAEETEITQPGVDHTANDPDPLDGLGEKTNESPIAEDGGQTLTGPTAEEAAKGEDGSKRTKSAKRAEAVAVAKATEGEPEFKEVLVTSLSDYFITQQPKHKDAKEQYWIRPSSTDAQWAFDDEWLRMNIKAGLLKLHV